MKWSGSSPRTSGASWASSGPKPGSKPRRPEPVGVRPASFEADVEQRALGLLDLHVLEAPLLRPVAGDDLVATRAQVRRDAAAERADLAIILADHRQAGGVLAVAAASHLEQACR